MIKKYFSQFLALLGGILLGLTGTAIAATTISTNIATGGTLSVTGTGSFTGVLSAAAQILASDGSVSAPGYSFTSAADSGMYMVGTNNLRFSADGVNGLIVSDTQVTLPVSGSATAPSLAFPSSNTGFFYAGTNSIGVTTAGSERIRVTAAGKMGIGTTTPTGNLEVHDTDSETDFLVSNPGGVGALRIRAWNDGGGNGVNFDSQANNGVLYFGRDNTLSKLIVQSGNVGIGTTTPYSKLQVTAGASGTTTVTIGEIQAVTTSKSCVNMTQANGTKGSFYLAGGVMIVENGYCK